MKQRLVLTKDKFKIDINNEMYWSPRKVLSYNPYLAMIEGGRGIGKTTQMLAYVLNAYCKGGDRFVYIRRYKPEIKQFVDTSKAPLSVIADGFTYRGDKNGGYTCYYDDDVVGYATPLSTSKSYKSSKFKNVKWIIFDEFTLKRGSTNRYLTDEVTTFFEFISTIVRTDKEYKIIMLGNNLDMFNPYAEFFKVPLFEYVYYDKKRNIVCERPKNNPKLLEEEEKTPLFKILQGTAYAEYHYFNKLLTNTKIDVIKKPINCRLYIRIVINNETLNIYMYNEAKELRLFVEQVGKKIDGNISYPLIENGNNNIYYITLYRKRFYMYLQRFFGLKRIGYGSERACVLFNFIMEEF